MKVLFVSSGRKGVVGDVVGNQGKSLEKEGIDLDYFIIKSGIWGYIGSVTKLRKVFLEGSYDLVHAHYSLSGYIAGLAGCKPLVVSLMGSDVYTSGFSRKIIRFFIRNRWNSSIVKTRQMKECLGIESVHVIPNGVNIDKFKPIPREIAREHIGYKEDKKLILFIAVKNREEKNIDLALEAVKHLNDKNIDFKHIYDAPNSEIPYYLNAADVLLLTSRREGSVNVVKEALACNCPVVATDVGDIAWLLKDLEGCYITTYYPLDVADKILAALYIGRLTNGRDRIVDLGLDSHNVSTSIIRLYEKLVKKDTKLKGRIYNSIKP